MHQYVGGGLVVPATGATLIGGPLPQDPHAPEKKAMQDMATEIVALKAELAKAPPERMRLAELEEKFARADELARRLQVENDTLKSRIAELEATTKK